MEEETDSDIERQPRQIEQGARAGAAQEASDLVEIAHRLQPIASPRRLEGKARYGIIGARRHLLVDRTADPQQNPASDRVQNPLKSK